ncbi:MAG: c-type cytochrome [Burkholderiales bacterium]
MAHAQVEEHSSLIKTPTQLIVVIVLSFLIPVLGIVMIAKIVVGGAKPDPKGIAMSEAAVAQRIKPVGEVVIAQATAPAGARSGEEVYRSVCAVCHDAGVLAAPKLADAAAWKPRFAQGKKTLVRNAVKGIRQMPARGGNPTLTDAEVERAVVFIGNKSGGNF